MTKSTKQTKSFVIEFNFNYNFGIFETSYSEFLILLYKSKYQLSSWKIQHGFQEANAYADALARKEVSFQQDFCVLDSLLVESSHLLLHDLSGLFCNRLCFVTTHVGETKFLIYIHFTTKKKRNIHMTKCTTVIDARTEPQNSFIF